METNTKTSPASDPIDPLPVSPTQDAPTPKRKVLTGFAKVWAIFWIVANLGAACAPASNLTNPRVGGIYALLMLLSAVVVAGYILLYNKKPVGLLMILIANILGFFLNFIEVIGYTITVTTGLIMGIITYFVTRKQVEYLFGKSRSIT